MKETLDISSILKKDAKLSSEKLNEKSIKLVSLIEETQKRQVEILKLKEVDQSSLRMVVQL